MNDARVPTIQILYAAVLRRYLSHDLLELDDGIKMVLDLELPDDDGFEVLGTFRTDFGGDHEDGAPCSAADEVFGAGHGRGAATFDAWTQRKGEYGGTEREERGLPFCIMMLNISVTVDMVDSCRGEMHRMR